MSPPQARSEAHEVKILGKLGADLIVAFGVDRVKPVAVLLTRYVLFFALLFIQAILETAGHVVQNLEFAKKWALLQDCDDKQARAVDDIHPGLVDEVDCIKVVTSFNDCLVVLKILDVQTSHNLADKVFVCYVSCHLLEVSEEVL